MHNNSMQLPAVAMTSHDGKRQILPSAMEVQALASVYVPHTLEECTVHH